MQSLDVVGLHLMPCDKQYVVVQSSAIQVFEYGEGVRPNDSQERIGGRLKTAMPPD